MAIKNDNKNKLSINRGRLTYKFYTENIKKKTNDFPNHPVHLIKDNPPLFPLSPIRISTISSTYVRNPPLRNKPV